VEEVKMKIAKLFKNGRSQALRLPKKVRFKEEPSFKITWTLALFLLI